MNDDQLNKLIKTLDKRFDGIDKRFDGIDQKLEEHDDTFAKMFTHIEDFRTEVNDKLDRKAEASALDNLINTMDDFIRHIKDNDVENAARDAQFARLVEWAREVSKKTGIPMPNL